MDEMNACTECGFTTNSIEMFTSHIEHHEEEHRSSSGELSQAQTVDWTAHSSGSDSSTPSPTSSISEKSPTVNPKSESPNLSHCGLSGAPSKLDPTVIKELVPKSTKTVHVCPHCNFTTFMSQHMKSHLEAHERHQGQMYQCDICQMQFSQKANMHRHRMRHSGVKPYECRYCKKRFFRKDQMQEHSMTHIKTGADFNCPVAFCKQQFSQHSQLRSHLDEAHAISPSSPASCKRCSLLFANSRRLLLHYQTRHDDSEGSPLPTDRPTEVPMKKRRHVPEDPSFFPTQKVQDIVKKEVLSPSVQKSNNQNPNELENGLAAPMYPVTSQDFLLMCLSNSSGLAQSALMAANSLSMEQTLRLWADPLGTSTTQLPPTEDEAHSPSFDSGSSNVDVVDEPAKASMECNLCGIVFFDQTMHLLHKGLHTEADPWRCNLCGTQCGDKYMFSTHVIFANHST